MRYWLIRGYDGLNTIFETKVRSSQFSEKQIQVLLPVLTAKAGLEFSEIINEYGQRKSKMSSNLLKVSMDSSIPMYLCGDNPHFTACLVDERQTITSSPSA